MSHDIQELNRYTGFLTGVCALALIFLFFILGTVGSVVQRFHADYRKVHNLDQWERHECENPDIP
jgi:hypothetical protein